MNNSLIDNSEKFLMKDMLCQFIGSGKYNHICIATGYWDLPGMQLVYDELKAFLESGGKLDILIGQEPQLRSYQLHAPEDNEERFFSFVTTQFLILFVTFLLSIIPSSNHINILEY